MRPTPDIILITKCALLSCDERVFVYTTDTRVIGFKLETKATGTYRAQVFTVSDDVRGRADLTIRVEQPVKTKMRCVMKVHRTRGCFVTPTGIA